MKASIEQNGHFYQVELYTPHNKNSIHWFFRKYKREANGWEKARKLKKDAEIFQGLKRIIIQKINHG